MQDSIHTYPGLASGKFRTQGRTRISRSIGHFVNLLFKLNRYIERQNKKGKDIPRFTKSQVRLIFRYLEGHRAFRDPVTNRPTSAQMRVFRAIVHEFNKKLPNGWEKKIV